MAIRSNGNVYQYGNTVRFECSFYNFSDEKIDPSFVKIIIYDKNYNVLSENTLGAANKLAIGDYFYDYATEEKEQKIYYEWYGEINGKPSVKRKSIITKFI